MAKLKILKQIYGIRLIETARCISKYLLQSIKRIELYKENVKIHMKNFKNSIKPQ